MEGFILEFSYIIHILERAPKRVNPFPINIIPYKGLR